MPGHCVRPPKTQQNPEVRNSLSQLDRQIDMPGHWVRTPETNKTHKSENPSGPPTSCAALIKLRRHPVEQRVHSKGQVKLLDVQRLPGGLQGG